MENRIKIERETFIYFYVYLLRDVEFTSYVSHHLDTRKLTFVRQKPAL